MGWMILKQNPKNIGRTDISDLNENKVVVWQHRNYVQIALFMGVVFPMLIAGVGWGDYRGGFVYAGILRLFFVQQATFCINSLAHWMGEQPFDDRHTPRNSLFTAFITLGEGYHNFHHEFPTDYRTTTQWHQYDPTKWAIWSWKQLGLASDLQRFRSNEIEKGRLQQLQKKLSAKQGTIDWGMTLSQLPMMEWDDFVDKSQRGSHLIVIAGVVHDVSNFIEEHPGGKSLIKSGIGKDATAMVNGGVYSHSNAAHNVLSTMRVAVIRGGCEVEIWKHGSRDEGFKDMYETVSLRAGRQVTKTRQKNS
jgi:stearoyl-CoA desaturase (delta-9 desaturase)